MKTKKAKYYKEVNGLIALTANVIGVKERNTHFFIDVSRNSAGSNLLEWYEKGRV
jgi:hypothetical protein